MKYESQIWVSYKGTSGVVDVQMSDVHRDGEPYMRVVLSTKHESTITMKGFSDKKTSDEYIIASAGKTPRDCLEGAVKMFLENIHEKHWMDVAKLDSLEIESGEI